MIKVPSNHLIMGLDTLTEMVNEPLFNKEDLVKEKDVICEEIKMYRDQPAERVHEILEGLMWPNNPLGRSLTGTISTVNKMKRKDLVDFKEKYYHPANIAIVAAGKIDLKSMVKYAEKNYLGKKRRRPSFETPSTEQEKFRVKFASGETNQTHVAMGFYVDGKNKTEKFAIKLLSVILGGNMSSRLFDELREKYGLCYDISSTYKRHKDVGEFVIHAGVDNKKVVRSVIAIIEELRKIRDSGVTDDELVRAKEFAKGQFLLAMENTSARMVWFGDRLMVDGSIPDAKKLLEYVDTVTKKDILKAAAKIFKSSLMNLAIVGKLSDKDKKRIKRELGDL